MKQGYTHSIEKAGEYVYINGHGIKFSNEKLAEEFLIKLIQEGFLD